MSDLSFLSSDNGEMVYRSNATSGIRDACFLDETLAQLSETGEITLTHAHSANTGDRRLIQEAAHQQTKAQSLHGTDTKLIVLYGNVKTFIFNLFKLSGGWEGGGSLTRFSMTTMNFHND